MQLVRSNKGRIKREMFAKLRTAKYMKTQASPNEAVIEFAGNVQRMAPCIIMGCATDYRVEAKRYNMKNALC